MKCADLLSSAITEPVLNSQLVWTPPPAARLLPRLSVDRIPQPQQLAFREAVSKLELSLQELQVSSLQPGLRVWANPVPTTYCQWLGN